MRYFRKTTVLVLSAALLMTAGKIMNTQPPPAPASTETGISIPATVIQKKPVPEPTMPEPKITPNPEPAARIYDIPLEDELQEYTFRLCIENDVDYETVLAVMELESNFQEKAISKTNDYGLMQINKANHKQLSEKLGISDFLDAKQNILAGVHILAGLIEKYEDLNKVLMAYNRGENGARKLWEKGITSNQYSRAIIVKADELRKENDQ